MKKWIRTAALLCAAALLIVCLAGCGMSGEFPAEDEIGLTIQLDLKEDIGLLVIDYVINGHEGSGGISNADKTVLAHNDVLDWTFRKQDFDIAADTAELDVRFRVITEYCDPNYENDYPEEYTVMLNKLSFRADFGETYHMTVSGNKADGYLAVLDTPVPDQTQPAAENTTAVLNKDGTLLGEIDSRAACTAADGGIFYSIFAPGEGQATANAEYRFFNMGTKQDVLLGTLEDQGYEAVYARTEYNGKIYTLAVIGNPLSDKDVRLVLLAFDPAAGAMKTHTVSETGFPYAAMAVSDGKLLIMNHEMTTPKRDKIYEFDPAAETVREVLTFSSDTDSLRGVSDAEDGFYLLRLRINNGSENELFLDRYDNNYGKVEERNINETLLTAAMQIHGVAGRQDALNELGMIVSRFAVEEGRYLFYANFGLTRAVIDLQTDEILFAEDDVYAVSVGSGATCVFRMDFDPENVEAPDIRRIADGEFVQLSFEPTDSHKLINEVSHAANGTWLVRTSDGSSVQNSTFALYLWTESGSED